MTKARHQVAATLQKDTLRKPNQDLIEGKCERFKKMEIVKFYPTQQLQTLDVAVRAP